MFQSLRGTPTASIFRLIDCSIGERMHQLFLSNDIGVEFCLIKSLDKNRQKGGNLSNFFRFNPLNCYVSSIFKDSSLRFRRIFSLENKTKNYKIVSM